jgi:hypothetical protein
LFIQQKVHSACTVFTNLQTLEFKPNILLRNLNKNSLHLFVRNPQFQSLHKNFKIFSPGRPMSTNLKLMNEQWCKKYLDFLLYISFLFLIFYCVDLIYFSFDDDFDCCRKICGSLLPFLKVN